MSAEAKLRAFAQDVMGDWPHECGLDGFELQDLAVKHGLLAPVEVTEPCQPEGCWCEEYNGDFEGGVTCYRKTELLTGEGTSITITIEVATTGTGFPPDRQDGLSLNSTANWVRVNGGEWRSAGRGRLRTRKALLEAIESCLEALG